MNILSLGAGVQSSTLFLMALHGEFEQMPSAAIFADTQNEPPAVYAWLDELERISAGRIPIQRVTRGDIAANTLSMLGAENKKGMKTTGHPPLFVRNNANDARPAARVAGGRLWRNCTADYKLLPIRQAARLLMTATGAKTVTQWIGISLDEAHRMKDSRVGYITNIYPLVDRKMTRNDCLNWLIAHGYACPPKSSCIICPYHSNQTWRAMQRDDPASFAQAVEFDARLRENGKLPYVIGDCYLHRSFIPLSEVDLTNAADHGQQSMFYDDFGQECEGMCGL